MKLRHYLAALFVMALMSSCAESDYESNYSSERLVIVGSDNNTHDFVDSMIDSFAEDSEIIVDRKYFASSDMLSAALLGGEQIDIIISDRNLNVSVYANKGMLADLTPYLDEDKYVSSVLEAMKINGKLYEVPYDFEILTAAVKSRLWNDDNDTSIEHIIEKSEQLGCSIPFDLNTDSYGFIAYIISEYIDFDNLSCRFDSDKFREFIEFMKQYYSKIEGASSQQLYDCFLNDELFMLETGFASIHQLNYLESEVGENVEFVGFPSEKSNYDIAVPSKTFSIVEKSENKAAAVELIEQIISFDAYVKVSSDSLSGGSAIPINKEALEYEYKLSIERDFYGIPEEIRQENADELMRHINTVSYASNSFNQYIYQILQDELLSFFNSNMDSLTVSQNIQNRCELFFSERYSQ